MSEAFSVTVYEPSKVMYTESVVFGVRPRLQLVAELHSPSPAPPVHLLPGWGAPTAIR